ncbi:MAG: NUDIX domain-containing protein [Desulfobacterota bacterium]|nr:NUDIX domain-containing protein [Thermodesulfobacteriota bacterium]
MTAKTKPSKISAGLLMYRRRNNRLEVFLVHPGGPFFEKKDEGVWSIPKGEIESNEDLLKTAIREFIEETGIQPKGEFLPLGHIKQKNGKIVYAWAFEGDISLQKKLKSNNFILEWPPHSGKLRKFPEIDRGEFFDWEIAPKKINPAQVDLLERLKAQLDNKV